MKWLIASDLHGSAECCEALLKAYEREGADRLLLLGDILYKKLGTKRNKQTVAEMLNPMADRIVCVRGNCDSDEDISMLVFPVEPNYLRIPIGHVAMFATHGHMYNDTNLPPNMDEGDILLHGHTHVPRTENRGHYLCFNPGSVSSPLWGSERGYMTAEDGSFRWLTLEGEEYRRYEL